jgi:hypothetical protein
MTCQWIFNKKQDLLTLSEHTSSFLVLFGFYLVLMCTVNLSSFVWPLYCMSFLNLQLLIISLISPNLDSTLGKSSNEIYWYETIITYLTNWWLRIGYSIPGHSIWKRMPWGEAEMHSFSYTNDQVLYNQFSPYFLCRVSWLPIITNLGSLSQMRLNEYQLKSISFNYNICGIWKIFNNTRQRNYGLNCTKPKFIHTRLSQNIRKCIHSINKGNNKITELRTIFQRGSQNS